MQSEWKYRCVIQKPEEIYYVKVQNAWLVQQEINGISSWWPDYGRPCANEFGLNSAGNEERLKGFMPLSKMPIFVFWVG